MTGHLIHIGLPKTGSTMLQRWFEFHPQLDFADGGIAGFHTVYQLAASPFIGDDPVRWRVTSSEALSSPTANAGTITLDSETTDVTFAGQKMLCHRLKEIFPTATILMVTRGFRSLCLSNYSQYVRHGGVENLTVFSGEFSQFAAFDLCPIISEYRQIFGDEQLIILPYELLRDDMDAFLTAIEMRLAIQHADGFKRYVNAALSPIKLRWYPLISRWLKKLPLPGRIKARIIRKYQTQIFYDRLGFLVRFLQKFWPLPPVTLSEICADFDDNMRGKGDILRGQPYYDAYMDDYLIHQS